MEEKRLDIKDFQPYSSVSDNDKVLMAKGVTGTDASITIALLRTILTNGIKPEIKDGVWYIGGVSTGVSAGAVQLRLGENGIEYRYSDNDEWAMLITVSKLQEPAVNIAEELRTHPCKVSENYTWMIWDAANKVYTDTGISARGRSPIIRDMIWWVWDEEKGDYVSTGQAVNDTFVLTKEAVEGVFVGNIVGHHHLEYTVPTIDSVPTDTTLSWTDSDNNLYMFYVGQLCRVADLSSDNGYKFYQLYDIKDGAAVWGEISGGGGVGKTYKSVYPNGEIFNDYANNIAFGQYAHAEGRETNATGPRAHAEGYKTNVFAADSHSEGRETWTVGNYSHSEGIYTITYGSSSHSEGSVETDFESGEGSKKILNDEEKIRDFLNSFTTKVYPDGEEGAYYHQLDSTLISDYVFHGAFGVSTHAEGINNIVCDKAGHVEGYNNLAGDMIPGHGQDSKVYAPHIEGIGNRVYSRLYAVHVGGAYNTVNSGNYTFAHGYNLSISNDYEVAFGRWNASEVDGKKVVFSVGIGSSETDRKNAISLFEDGTVSIPSLKVEVNVEGLEEEILLLQNNVTALSNKLSSVEQENETLENDIDDLLLLIAQLHGNIKVFVLGRKLVFTKYIDAKAEEDILLIIDSETSVSEDTLICPNFVKDETTAKVENGILIL
ncbi:hypothetical protein [Phocaeicola barnesiae]|uniref:hypothetical protein n=1 Tax=Phocaeicola barnesiae TaxID=376804 RepID=UPI0025A33260|nr:hypothetical protein [Phocaeicola barnesiae]MDM8253367.1 hypothetical protein [Phocaeicola barnesiae]